MGSNPKIANLINMSERIAHDIVVLADSDIRVRRDYLSRLVGALERFGGAVTCPYYGISTGNLWSQLAQLTIDSHFLPGVVVGARLKLSRPCLGSTIALRRQSLVAIGGFEPLADCLADDYVLGELLQRARRAGDGAAVRGRPCLQRIVVCRIVAARAALGADHPHHRPARLSRLDRDARVSAGADRLGDGRRMAPRLGSVWRPWPAAPS